jgi:hypothetical protein
MGTCLSILGQGLGYQPELSPNGPTFPAKSDGFMADKNARL